MWEQIANHDARFRVSDWTLQVEARENGLKLSVASNDSQPQAGRVQLSGLRLPPISESFVRGDELHLVMPQIDGYQVGMELSLLMIEADPQQFVLETVIALQTQQLDLHPRVTLSAGSSTAESDRWTMQALVASRWYGCEKQDASCSLQLSVLVDPRDRFSLDESQADHQRLSFFGDFMEKGVIRKVQPWWIWSRAELSSPARHQLAEELAHRPLPLAT